MEAATINQSATGSAKSVLQSLTLFSQLDETLLERFAKASQLKTFHKGDILFLQDDEADWIYVIVSGWLKLFRETVDGHEAVIDMITKGQLVGDTAVIENGVHQFGAAAIEETVALRIPSSLLKAAIKEDHQMALAMVSALSKLRAKANSGN